MILIIAGAESSLGLGICLFNGGVVGIIVSRGSLIRVLMCLELLLLSVSLLIVN